jgi:hypothetical protein
VSFLILAFNLATDDRKTGSTSFVNPVGVLMLKFLLEHKRKLPKSSNTDVSSSATKPFNFFSKLKSKCYGNRQSKV